MGRAYLEFDIDGGKYGVYLVVLPSDGLGVAMVPFAAAAKEDKSISKDD